MALAYKGIFQSTLPVRGATSGAFAVVIVLVFQSTLPVRGATAKPGTDQRTSQFQSTLPVRGATNIFPGHCSQG